METDYIPYYYIAAFNLNNELFKDRLVRIAMNYAIEKEPIVKSTFEGEPAVAGDHCLQILSFHSGTPMYPYNPKKALEFLHIAGWGFEKGEHILSRDGKRFQFELLVSKALNYENATASHIKEQLSDIGIEINIKWLSISDKIAALFKKQYESSLVASNYEINMDSSYAFFHSSQIENGLNFYSYSNSRVDNLLEQGRIETDKTKRLKIVKNFHYELYNDPPGIFLLWKESFIEVSKSVNVPVFKEIFSRPVRLTMM